MITTTVMQTKERLKKAVEPVARSVERAVNTSVTVSQLQDQLAATSADLRRAQQELSDKNENLRRTQENLRAANQQIILTRQKLEDAQNQNIEMVRMNKEKSVTIRATTDQLQIADGKLARIGVVTTGFVKRSRWWRFWGKARIIQSIADVVNDVPKL